MAPSWHNKRLPINTQTPSDLNLHNELRHHQPAQEQMLLSIELIALPSDTKSTEHTLRSE
ncbi:MAG: hypothetical protein Q9187_001950 [Circinaria calcarea]